MSHERLKEIHELVSTLERRMKPLEWDLNRNQINEFQKQKLERFQKEYTSLLEERKALQDLA